jgi:hypothetical protein
VPCFILLYAGFFEKYKIEYKLFSKSFIDNIIDNIIDKVIDKVIDNMHYIKKFTLNLLPGKAILLMLKAIHYRPPVKLMSVHYLNM